jgi:hypothetical protein
MTPALSPDGSKFYFRRSSLPIGVPGTGGIFQVDLNSGEINKVIVKGTLQLTPNYKEILFGDRIIVDVATDSVIQTYGVIKNINQSVSNLELILHADTVLNVPNFISPSTFANFRLGAEVGSACDTLGPISVGVSLQDEDRGMVVFPNPNAGQLYIEIKNINAPSHFRILNSLGQLVYEWRSADVLQNIDLSKLNLNSGLYILQQNDKNGRFNQSKFIYQKP